MVNQDKVRFLTVIGGFMLRFAFPLLLVASLSPALASACSLYDSNGFYAGKVVGHKIYDDNDFLAGSFHGPSVLDANDFAAGNIKGSALVDENGFSKGQIEGAVVIDENEFEAGRFEHCKLTEAKAGSLLLLLKHYTPIL
jgi:hypothetical protein